MIRLTRRVGSRTELLTRLANDDLEAGDAGDGAGVGVGGKVERDEDVVGDDAGAEFDIELHPF